MQRLFGKPNGKFKALAVLELLMDGHIFPYNGRFWAINTENGRVGCLQIDEETKQPKIENDCYTIIYIWDDTLASFIEWANNIPDEEIVAFGSAVVLQEINQAGGLSRWSSLQGRKFTDMTPDF